MKRCHSVYYLDPWMGEGSQIQTALESMRPGFVVGQRFEVVERLDEDALAHFWAAQDTRNQKPIRLQLLRPGLISAVHTTELRDACKRAAALVHENIVRTLGVGKTPHGEVFVAGEVVDGVPLGQLIAQRTQDDEPMSLRGAYNVIAHICSGLSHAQPTMCHGALRADIIYVDNESHVKIAGFGVDQAILNAAGPHAFGESGFACLAPEVKSGEAPTVQSDVFGLGAVLYQLLTSKSPGADFVPPSHVRDDVNSAIDEVLLRCLSAEPAERYADATAVRNALVPHLTAANSIPPPPGLSSTSFDIDLASIMPPADILESLRPPSPPALPFPQTPDETTDVSSANLTKALEELSNDRIARWMVAEDRMDHGPFRARELVERLARGHFHPQASTMNTDTGERRPLAEWPQFREFALQREHEATVTAEQAARVEAKTSHKRASLFKLIGGGVAIAMIGLIAYQGISSLQADDNTNPTQTALDDLYELGDIAIKGEAGVLKAPSRRRGAGSRRAARPAAAGSSYEDAMNQAVELGDATQAGDESQLTGSRVASVMNKQVNRLYRQCVVPALKAGAQMSSVRIDLAIAGSGTVLGSSVRDGTPAFRSCMTRAVRTIRFPSFGASRMGAQYRFNVQ